MHHHSINNNAQLHDSSIRPPVGCAPPVLSQPSPSQPSQPSSATCPTPARLRTPATYALDAQGVKKRRHRRNLRLNSVHQPLPRTILPSSLQNSPGTCHCQPVGPPPPPLPRHHDDFTARLITKQQSQHLARPLPVAQTTMTSLSSVQLPSILLH
ncbi:uncharacterized protein BKA78DRAFT_54199 [Phyllosticta capitalensis]|uniref:uncharacterized protein n=1 Tax=Phyllosticta capitalensis TaxID=121624 RepID=UPI00312DEB03